MHEWSLCRNLLDQLTEVAAGHGAARIRRVHLQVGPLSGVESSLLETAFRFCRPGTVAENAELEIERPPARVHCERCQRDMPVPLDDLRCPLCHTPEAYLVSGTEMMLTAVDLEPGPATPDSPANKSGDRHV